MTFPEHHQRQTRHPPPDHREDAGQDDTDTWAAGRFTADDARREIAEIRSWSAQLTRRPAMAARRSRPDPDSRDIADPAGDLPPLSEPPGYKRTSRGWAYTATRALVPGARDVTLARLFRFPVDHDDWVAVPSALATGRDELAWVTRYVASGDDVFGLVGGHIMIPVTHWQARARVPLGIDAPELCAERLLGVADAAQLLGVKPATVSGYLAAGRLAMPVTRLSGVPLWSRPILEQWRDTRPGQGSRTDLAHRPSQ